MAAAAVDQSGANEYPDDDDDPIEEDDDGGGGNGMQQDAPMEDVLFSSIRANIDDGQPSVPDAVQISETPVPASIDVSTLKLLPNTPNRQPSQARQFYERMRSYSYLLRDATQALVPRGMEWPGARYISWEVPANGQLIELLSAMQLYRFALQYTGMRRDTLVTAADYMGYFKRQVHYFQRQHEPLNDKIRAALNGWLTQLAYARGDPSLADAQNIDAALHAFVERMGYRGQETQALLERNLVLQEARRRDAELTELQRNAGAARPLRTEPMDTGGGGGAKASAAAATNAQWPLPSHSFGETMRTLRTAKLTKATAVSSSSAVGPAAPWPLPSASFVETMRHLRDGRLTKSKGSTTTTTAAVTAVAPTMMLPSVAAHPWPLASASFGATMSTLRDSRLPKSKGSSSASATTTTTAAVPIVPPVVAVGPAVPWPLPPQIFGETMRLLRDSKLPKPQKSERAASAAATTTVQRIPSTPQLPVTPTTTTTPTAWPLPPRSFGATMRELRAARLPRGASVTATAAPVPPSAVPAAMVLEPGSRAPWPLPALSIGATMRLLRDSRLAKASVSRGSNSSLLPPRPPAPSATTTTTTATVSVVAAVPWPLPSPSFGSTMRTLRASKPAVVRRSAAAAAIPPVAVSAVDMPVSPIDMVPSDALVLALRRFGERLARNEQDVEAAAAAARPLPSTLAEIERDKKRLKDVTEAWRDTEQHLARSEALLDQAEEELVRTRRRFGLATRERPR